MDTFAQPILIVHPKDFGKASQGRIRINKGNLLINIFPYLNQPEMSVVNLDC